MKMPVCLALFAALFVFGCSDNSTKPVASTNAAAPGNNPLNAPADYVGGLASGQSRAVKVIDTASLNQAVQMFQAQEGRFPRDLQELVARQWISKIPDPPRGMKIVYDANTGQVSVAAE